MLSVEIPIDAKLLASLKAMPSHPEIRAVIAHVRNEKILRKWTIQATPEMATDMEMIRQLIIFEQVDGCFIVIRIDDKNFGFITYTNDKAKPKDRMVYASSGAHLRKSCELYFGADNHVNAPEQIKPEMYKIDFEKCHNEMMTADEKLEKELAALPVAKPMAMAGLACKLHDDASAVVESFKAKKIRAATFSVKDSVVHHDKSIPTGGSDADVVAALPEKDPRFALVWQQEKSVMVYMCPENINPKERMPYSSAKASFLSQIGDMNAKPDVKVEHDTPDTLFRTIADYMSGAMEDVVIPEEKKEPRFKGPRMLI